METKKKMSEISARIDNKLLEQSKKRADLVRATGISEGTVRGWIKGAIPNAEAAYKVAQYLGVTVEWLVTGIDNKSENQNLKMYTEQERELIEIFRHLDDRDKNAVLTLAQSLESQYSSTTKTNTSAG